MCSSLYVQVCVILFLLWSLQLVQVLVCGVWLADFLNKKQLLSLSSTVIIVTVLRLRLSGSCVKLWDLRSLESWGLKIISSAWPWSYLCNNLQVTYGYRYKTDLSLKSCVFFSLLFLKLLALFVSSSLKVLPPPPPPPFFFRVSKTEKIAFLCVCDISEHSSGGGI